MVVYIYIYILNKYATCLGQRWHARLVAAAASDTGLVHLGKPSQETLAPLPVWRDPVEDSDLVNLPCVSNSSIF